MERERQIKIDTIEDLNQLFKIDSKCQQVSLIDVTSKPVLPKADETQIGFYAVYVKVPSEDRVLVSKEQNDEAVADMTMLAPGSTVREIITEQNGYKQVIGLFFSPDLIALLHLEDISVNTHSFSTTTKSRCCWARKKKI